MFLAFQTILILVAIIATDRLASMRKEKVEITPLRRQVSLVIIGLGLIASLTLLLEILI